MSAKKTRRPVRSLLALLIAVIVGLGALAIGSARGDASMSPGLALDLEGGTQLILTPTTTDGSEITDEDINQAIEIIRQRVDASGVAEAEITRQGGQNIVVALPGEPSQETLDLVRSSAVLYFRPVIRSISGSAEAIASIQNQYAAAAASAAATEEATDAADDTEATEESADAEATEEATAEASAEATAIASVTPEEVAAAYADLDGDGEISDESLESTSDDNSSDSWISEQMIYDAYMTDCTAEENLTGESQDPDAAVISCAQDGSGIAYILGPVDISGTDIDNATSGLQTTSTGQTTSTWVVDLSFNSEGTEAFTEVSERLLAYRDAADLDSSDTTSVMKSEFAVVLDGLTVMASGFQDSVTSPITNGQVEISGGFTQSSANTLANQLSFGSLPLNFTVQSEEKLSATLGTEQLRNGLIAGLIGFLLIMLYLAWQYRGLAVVAVASLLTAAVSTYTVIALLSWTMDYRLSLAGVAGLIVAIGITADSFIIYFERVRDEVRSGRVLSEAVEKGWQHARQTIIISDAVNLVAAVVLYFLAVGGVQGFAFTLGLTTLVDLAVVILFTHPLMSLIIRIPFYGQGHSWSGLDPEHLGAESLAAYGTRREAMANNIGESLARRKAKARREENVDSDSAESSAEENVADQSTDVDANEPEDGETK